MAYALFDGDKRVGEPQPTEPDVWKQALASRLIRDVPVADEAGGQVLPAGFHIKEVAEAFEPSRIGSCPRAKELLNAPRDRCVGLSSMTQNRTPSSQC